jgi:hypothetical protein
MYVALLHTHNLTRSLVLLAALAAIAFAVVGLVRGGVFTRRQRIVNVAFVAVMDLQLLLGIALYTVSPLVRTALGDMGAAMSNTTLRFFAIEHTTVMLIAVALAHVGSALVRRAASDRAKHARSLTWFGLSLAAVLFGIPWDRAFFPGG